MTKNIKKTVGISMVFILCIIGIVGMICIKIAPQHNHMLVHAKTDEYTSVREIEDDSNIIVCGKKIHEDPSTIEKDDDGNLLTVYTMSTFKIDSIKKNNGEIEINDKIRILENQGYDEKTNTTYHIAGYQKMKMNNEYFMLLRKADSKIDGLDYYIPVGVNYGKIPLDNNEEIMFKTDENWSEVTDIVKLKNKIGDKYDIY